MRVDAYVTINWEGSFVHGECAIAIVLKIPDKKPFIKIAGYKNLSYQKACALSACHVVDLINNPCDLTITIGDPYSYCMMTKSSYVGKAHRVQWEWFREKADTLPSVTIKLNKNHYFRTAAIHRTEKGGYYMVDVEQEGKDGKDQGQQET